MSKNRSKFLDSLDQGTFLGSTKISINDLVLTLKLADAAFGAQIRLSKDNVKIIKSSSDPSVVSLSGLKRPFEYWRMLGSFARDVQAEFVDMVNCLEDLLSKGKWPVEMVPAVLDIQFELEGLKFPGKKIPARKDAQ
jgi:hypothetical protein